MKVRVLGPIFSESLDEWWEVENRRRRAKALEVIKDNIRSALKGMDPIITEEELLDIYREILIEEVQDS